MKDFAVFAVIAILPSSLGVLFLVENKTARAAAQSQGQPVNLDHFDMPMPAGVDRASEALTATPTVNGVKPVLTRSYDNLRSGANTQEFELTPAYLRAAGGLRERFRVRVAGDRRGFESQPLLAPAVPTLDGQTHDLLVVSTMGNQVAAFDANDGTPIWQIRLGQPITGTKAIDGWLINDHWGILSTGVIRNNTWYGVTWQSPDGSAAKASHVLYALSLKDGSHANPPISLTKSGPMWRKQRASLTISGTTLFIPWGTVQETATGAHGFVTAIDLTSWHVAGEWNATAAGSGGGIWQAGQGLVADADGYLYAMTGNGDYDGKQNFSESFVKLHFDGGAFSVVDHYSPFRDANRAAAYDDMDLGSGGPSLIPELQVIFGAGKDGISYALPWRKLGAPIQTQWFTFYPGPSIPTTPSPDKLFFDRTHHMHSSSVTWRRGDGWLAFCWGENGNLRAWKVDAQGLHYVAGGTELASAQAKVPPGGMPGGFMALSADGQTDGIVWATVPDGDANRTVTTGHLLAYDVSTFAGDHLNLLWRSPEFVYNKFDPPVVSGGKVFVPTYDGQVLVYGL